jgi:hypothetical protein
VAEHHDFELLELIGSKAQRGELQDAPEYDVAERPNNDRLLRDDDTGPTTLRIRTGPTDG